ncbi:MAG: hypothetical protein RI884_1664 [Pseudomonadota bacterium]|jgi:hypothetical protein
MNPYDLAQRLIDRLGKLLGLQALSLEGGTHSCALEFDNHLAVTFEFHEPGAQLVLTSLLAVLPDATDSTGPNEPLLRVLLASNFVDYLQGGSFFGLEPQSRSLTLMQSRSVNELDDPSFERLVEAFVNKAELWKRQIEQLLSGNVPEGLVLPGTLPAAGAAAGTAPGPAARPADGAHIYG